MALSDEDEVLLLLEVLKELSDNIRNIAVKLLYSLPGVIAFLR